MVSIVQKDDPRAGQVLRANAVPVTKIEIGASELKKILSRMREALNREDDGVALAAPQIGVSKRVFVVSPMAYEIAERMKNERNKKNPEGEQAEDERKQDRATAAQIKKNYHLVYINPRIVKVSQEKKNLEEGCLSVRPLYGKVRRSVRATVEALDEYGNHFTQGASGLLAQIFQHETDHLDGVLFVDKAKDVREMPQTADI